MSRALTLFAEANQLSADGHWEQAAACLETLLNDDTLLKDEPLEGIALVDVLLKQRACLVRSGARHSIPQGFDDLPDQGVPISASTQTFWMEFAAALEWAADVPGARLCFRRLLDRPDLSPPIFINAHFRSGVLAEHQFDWDAAMTHYRTSIQAPPVYPLAQEHARFRLANLLYSADDHEQAGEHYAILRDATALPPAQRAESHFRFGRCLQNIGDLAGAQTVLQTCRSQFPGTELEVHVTLALAEIYRQRGQRAAAAECYRVVMEHPCAEPRTRAAALACAAGRL